MNTADDDLIMSLEIRLSEMCTELLELEVFDKIVHAKEKGRISVNFQDKTVNFTSQNCALYKTVHGPAKLTRTS